MKNQKNTKTGFTLIELLVVIAILGLLASIITASLNRARSNARDAKRIAEINQMRKAVEMYYLNHGEYPRVNNSWLSSGWSTFVGYLKGDGVLALNDYHENLATKSFSEYLVPKALAMAEACPSNVTPQDPLCECKPGDFTPSGGSIIHTYGFVSSSGQNWQYYKLRTQLENLNNSVLNSGLSGDFAASGDSGCNKTLGYYCIGDSNFTPD